jgi:hypothetical protein
MKYANKKVYGYIFIVNDYGTSKSICIKLTLENRLVIIRNKNTALELHRFIRT